MKRPVLISIALILIITLSCQKLLFDKDVTAIKIESGEFKSVNIHGIYNIVLVQDTVNYLMISGTNEVMKTVASVNNDTLFIIGSSTFTLNHSKNTLELHFRTLEFMVTYDPVYLTTLGIIKTERFSYDALGEISEANISIDCNNFTLVNSANTLGNFYISGSAEYSAFFNRYGSNMFAENLMCSYSEVITESVGQVRVNVSEKLVAYIWGPGNILYKGNPEITVAERLGKGEVKRLSY